MNERIKELRLALGLSQEAFGDALGVTRSSICTIESGSRNVTAQMFIAICREYNVNKEWLLSGDGNMFNTLTRQQEAARLVGKAFDTNDTFIINAFAALSELSPSELSVIKKFIKKLNEETDK